MDENLPLKEIYKNERDRIKIEKEAIDRRVEDLKRQLAEAETQKANLEKISKNDEQEIQTIIESNMKVYLESILTEIEVYPARPGCLYVPGTSGVIIFGKLEGDHPVGTALKHFKAFQDLGIVSPEALFEKRAGIELIMAGGIVGVYFTIDEESKIKALQKSDYKVESVKENYPKFYDTFMKLEAEVQKLKQVLVESKQILDSPGILPQEKLSRVDSYMASLGYEKKQKSEPTPYTTSSGNKVTPNVVPQNKPVETPQQQYKSPTLSPY